MINANKVCSFVHAKRKLVEVQVAVKFTFKSVWKQSAHRSFCDDRVSRGVGVGCHHGVVEMQNKSWLISHSSCKIDIVRGERKGLTRGNFLLLVPALVAKCRLLFTQVVFGVIRVQCKLFSRCRMFVS